MYTYTLYYWLLAVRTPRPTEINARESGRAATFLAVGNVAGSHSGRTAVALAARMAGPRVFFARRCARTIRGSTPIFATAFAQSQLPSSVWQRRGVV